MLMDPPVWTPSRRIIAPPRRIPARWRTPLRPARRFHRPWCPLYMTDGDEAMDANGDELMDTNGDEYYKCGCCGFLRAKVCDGVAYIDGANVHVGSYVDVWVLKSSIASFPVSFAYPDLGVCLSVDSGNTFDTNPTGTRLSSVTPATYGCAGPTFTSSSIIRVSFSGVALSTSCVQCVNWFHVVSGTLGTYDLVPGPFGPSYGFTATTSVLTAYGSSSSACAANTFTDYANVNYDNVSEMLVVYGDLGQTLFQSRFPRCFFSLSAPVEVDNQLVGYGCQTTIGSGTSLDQYASV